MDVVVVAVLVVIVIMAFAIGVFVGSHKRSDDDVVSAPLTPDTFPSVQQATETCSPDSPVAVVVPDTIVAVEPSQEVLEEGEPSQVEVEDEIGELTTEPLRFQDVEAPSMESEPDSPVAAIVSETVVVEPSERPSGKGAPTKAEAEDDVRDTATNEGGLTPADTASSDYVAVEELALEQVAELQADEPTGDEPQPNALEPTPTKAAVAESRIGDTSEVSLPEPVEDLPQRVLTIPPGRVIPPWPEGQDAEQPLVAELGPGRRELPTWLTSDPPEGVIVSARASAPREARVIWERTACGQRVTLDHDAVTESVGRSRYDIGRSASSPTRWFSHYNGWTDREWSDAGPFGNHDRIAAETDREALLRSEWDPIFIDGPNSFWEGAWSRDTRFFEDDEEA